MTVVIDDQNTAGYEQIVKCFELVFRGFIPVRVETQQGNGSYGRLRQRILDLPFEKSDLFKRIPGLLQGCFYFVQRRITPDIVSCGSVCGVEAGTGLSRVAGGTVGFAIGSDNITFSQDWGKSRSSD